MKAESIIFDLDGTLWDSSDNVAMSWNYAIEGCHDPRLAGISITGEDIKGVMGLTMDVIAAKFFPGLDPSERMEIMEKCADFENEFLASHGGSIYEKERETLERLSASHRLFIVSNCQCGYIETYLKFSGFGKYFTDILCWGDTGLPKGDTIREIMRRHDISSAVYAGDTQGDFDAAVSAGIPFIHCAYGFGKVSGGGHEVINSIDELTGLVIFP